MACPSGCLNGGGQLRPPPGQSAAQLLEELEVLYHSATSCTASASSNGHADDGTGALAGTPALRAAYERWVGGATGSPAARALLHTAYHKRERTVTSALADW